jgi:hypothetical protein
MLYIQNFLVLKTWPNLLDVGLENELNLVAFNEEKAILVCMEMRYLMGENLKVVRPKFLPLNLTILVGSAWLMYVMHATFSRAENSA